MKQITLNQWFFKNTKLPLLFLGTVVALVQIGFIFYTHNNSRSEQESALRSLVATVATIGIEQGNRPLLESSFQLAIQELGVKSMVVCQGSRVLFHEPLGFGSCPKPVSQGFFKSMVAITPSGFKDYRLYFYVNRFQFGPSLIALNVIIMLLLGVVFLIIFRIQKKMNDDILNPLQNDFVKDQDLKIKELSDIRSKYEEHHQSKEKQAIAGAILEHNLSIGHNIKSIQQTLDVIKSGEFASERQQSRVGQVSKDIKTIMAKIADQTPGADKVNLITSDETFFEYLQKENGKKTKVNVSNVFEIAVENKNIELEKTAKNIQINLKYSRTLKKSFIEVVGPELRDILSNMMNNSIEAEANTITLSILEESESIKIQISDNGKGIEPNVQPYIFDRGYTKDKKSGTGYGLYHAKKFITSWGGSFSLQSSEPGNTAFSIDLPLWKIPSMGLESVKKVIVVDDEDSVHEAWKSKLAKLNPLAEVISFKTDESFSEWFDDQKDISEHIFFFDSDLGQNQASGESLIDSSGVGAMAHLVTNNYNSPVLAKWCEDHLISLIPKGVIC